MRMPPPVLRPLGALNHAAIVKLDASAELAVVVCAQLLPSVAPSIHA